MARRRLLKAASKRPGEPLSPEDWEAYFTLLAQPRTRAVKWVLRSLPASPRCGYCGAPFAGFGSRMVKPLGFAPSRKNPSLCATCVELAPPGGTTMEAGILFADVRGFTALSEQADPGEMAVLLRTFYACAERALFPEALIDKLIGDEVMALYLPSFVRHDAAAVALREGGLELVAPVMLEHARTLLSEVGYGTEGGPFVEVGIGLAFGETFVGNVGQQAVHDFTAIGDVVNTASRLQGQARGGEILMSGPLAGGLEEPPGELVQLELKGRREPLAAYRVASPDAAARTSPTSSP